MIDPPWGAMQTTGVLHRWTGLSSTACGLWARRVESSGGTRCGQCARYRSQAERRAFNAERHRAWTAKIREAERRMEEVAGPVLEAWRQRRAA